MSLLTSGFHPIKLCLVPNGAGHGRLRDSARIKGPLPWTCMQSFVKIYWLGRLLMRLSIYRQERSLPDPNSITKSRLHARKRRACPARNRVRRPRRERCFGEPNKLSSNGEMCSSAGPESAIKASGRRPSVMEGFNYFSNSRAVASPTQ